MLKKAGTTKAEQARLSEIVDFQKKAITRGTEKGSSSYPQRRELFENQKKTVEKEIERLQKTLDMLRFKCWYYDTAIADGNEDRINEMLPNNLPDDIQKLYDHAHSDDED